MANLISKNLLGALGSLVMRSGRNAHLSILIYHRVLAEPDPMLRDEVDAKVFRMQMDALGDSFNVLPLGEAVERLARKALPPRAACITFDDGYANNATVALPILQERSMTATFFVSTGFTSGGCMWNDLVIEALRDSTVERLELSDMSLGSHKLDTLADRLSAMGELLPKLKQMNPDSRRSAVEYILDQSGTRPATGMMMTPAQIKTLADAGMEIGGHTVTHPILSTLTDQQARIEIGNGKESLEAITGQRVRLFAYPNGRPGKDFDERHVALLKEFGFDAAVTTARGTSRCDTDPYLLPRFTPWDRTHGRFTLRLYQNALTDLNAG